MDKRPKSFFPSVQLRAICCLDLMYFVQSRAEIFPCSSAINVRALPEYIVDCMDIILLELAVLLFYS